MTYKIARDGQEFGPYSLSDVQRYVGTGNILLTDMALAEGSTEWVPVAQVVGTIPVAQPVVPSGYAPTAVYPDPPNLHWALVLLFTIVTCGVFSVVWDFVQVMWMRKVEPSTKAFPYFLVFLVLWALNFVVSFNRVMFSAHGVAASQSSNGAAGIISIAGFVFILLYRFKMRDSMEQHFNGPEPIGLSLGPVMTFFFGGLYFQYHFNRINDIKRAYRLSNPY